MIIINKAIDKIKKLLALSKSSNEHEAQLAMLKAQELLVKYKLSIREVENCKIENSDILTKETNISFRAARWKGRLAGLIADNFGCYCYFRGKRTNIITFLGREEDVTVCNIVFDYALDCIKSVTNGIRYQYRKEGYDTKDIVGDYAIEFISGLRDNFEEQKRNNIKWALVLVKDIEVTERYKDINFVRTININQKFKGNSDVLKKGIKDGKEFSISDKIEQGKTSEIEQLK